MFAAVASKGKVAKGIAAKDGPGTAADAKAMEASFKQIEDYWSKKLYSVHVPEGETFRISFGMNMRKAEPEFKDARRNDRVSMRCIRTEKEHLSRLDDGREVVVLTATH